MNKFSLRFLLLMLLLVSNYSVWSQLKYWINLTDKNGTPYSITNPSAFLSAQSIARRNAYNIPVTASDLPVNPAYIAQIENVPDVTVIYASKWLNGVVVSIPNKTLAMTALSTIKTFSFVADSFRVKRVKLTNLVPDKVLPQDNNFSNRTNNDPSGSFNYGGSYWQNKQLNVICLHEQGYRGQGMTIAVMDAGFANVNTYHVFDSLRNNGGILGTRDFVDGQPNAYFGSTHGTMVLSCMAGNKPGRILGSAPMAKYWLIRTEEGAAETVSEEYNWIRGAEFADSVGADILTTSLGYTDFDIPSQNHNYAGLNGRTYPMSIAATIATRKGMFVLNAAGNEGQNTWHYISVAGDADSICTVGAVDSLNKVAGFSGVGPTSDGRIKPDLTARGVGAWVSDGNYDGFPGNGTSFATPILAGAVACYWQANKNLNSHQVLDTLKKMATNHLSPDNSQGWGLPNLSIGMNTYKLFGTVKLKDKTTHENILVEYIHEAPSTQIDSVRTNNQGAYSILINANPGRLKFSKPNYISQFYNDSSIVSIPRCNAISSVTLSPLAVPIDPAVAFDFYVYVDKDKNELHVYLTKANYSSILVEITDFVGRSMMNTTIPNTQFHSVIDISSFPDYAYIIKVTTSLGIKTLKFVKQ